MREAPLRIALASLQFMEPDQSNTLKHKLRTSELTVAPGASEKRRIGPFAHGLVAVADGGRERSRGDFCMPTPNNQHRATYQ